MDGEEEAATAPSARSQTDRFTRSPLAKSQGQRAAIKQEGGNEMDGDEAFGFLLHWGGRRVYDGKDGLLTSVPLITLPEVKAR